MTCHQNSSSAQYAQYMFKVDAKAGVSKQRNGVMRNEKQLNGIKIFIKGGDNTSFIMNRIFFK